ncbi:KAP-like P-loop domain-containing protein [Sphingomonas sp. PP-F2F-A104-K0414]|uniref:P-loop NTPase fold protein n=1 Tax=Sphingomonas sp. PP-F2F-A104-K0414 TaxID=2135661 RepID=UPI001045E5F5|nr:KAP-like P-loop domain-containing protein [Sphingomonas sp. PP-F2F-A104-K0414]
MVETWTDDREARLISMWNAGVSVAQIAEELGGVSRNAVKSKVDRLKLPHRATIGRAPADAPDPILAIAGMSTTLKAMNRWIWAGGQRYLSQDVRRAMDLAAKIAALSVEGNLEIDAIDLVAATIGSALESNVSKTMTDVSAQFRDENVFIPPPALDAMRQPMAKPDNALLRWDVVDLISDAAAVRARTMTSRGSIEFSHLLAAIVGSPTGLDALHGLLSSEQEFAAFRRTAIGVLRNLAAERGIAVAWASEIARIEGASPDRGDRRAGYSSDRVATGTDVFGTSTDARALADVILLEAAAPPLAIGIFGAWGSGKSTLMAELKSEIGNQIAAERSRRPDPDEDPGLARVTGVMQLEFNAWSFADSENLWASLTAELFDQIAAGGIGGKADDIGTRLVAEVAALTGREASELTIARMQLKESEALIDDATKAVEEAQAREQAGLALAITRAFDEVLRGRKPTKDDEKDGGQNDGAGDDADDGGAKKRTAVDTVREALLIDEEDGGKLAKKYAEAGADSVELGMFVSRWARTRAAKRSLLWLAAIGVFAVAAYLLLNLTGIARWLGPTGRSIANAALALAPTGYATLGVVAPIFRAVSVIRRKFVEARVRNAAELASAEGRLRKSERAKTEAEAAIAKSRKIVERYSTVDDVGSPPPALMLDYLLKDSAEVAALRGRLGTLGTVRRCFEQLNHLVERMNASEQRGPVQRIVIYIDDLDRCSERQVVQILEAIHLMLAFPCFVVVAAVDVRWLRAALVKEHRALSGGEHTIDPADYLEKIFQIPFWVRTLAPGETENSGYVRYINTLLRPGASTPVLDASEEEEEEDDDGAGVKAAGTFPRLEPARPPIADADRARRQLAITDEELRVMEAMQPIAARSPRAVKRMVNIFRLIRVSIPENRLGDYLTGGGEGPPYWVIILALALDTGLPPGDMATLIDRLGRIDGEDFDAIVGYSRRIYTEAEIHALAPNKSVVLDLLSSHAGKVLERGLHALDRMKRNVGHHHLLRAFDLAGRYSFRVQ